MFDSFSKEPDHINEKGVKWWKDDFLTDHAAREDHNGISLKGITVWLVEKPNGYRTRLIIENDKPIYESQQLEGIGFRIDVLKLLKHFELKEKP